ncbi:9378_t:CDS:2, partial [Funneliformis mosseae]
LVGYHGNKYNDNDAISYGPKFMTGDTIGCCLNFRNSTIFYTRNGVNLDIAFQDIRDSLYPCVRMMSPGGSIGANFGYRELNNWAEILNPYNDKLINLQINKFSDLVQSSETEQNIKLLKY